MRAPAQSKNTRARAPRRDENPGGDRLVMGVWLLAGLAVAGAVFLRPTPPARVPQTAWSAPVALAAVRPPLAATLPAPAPSMLAPETVCQGAKDDPSLMRTASGLTASGLPVVLHPLPKATPEPFVATGDAWLDAVPYLNAQRALLGLPAMAPQAGLARAATTHAFYDGANGVVGHDEDEGRIYFRGATPADRIGQEFASPYTNEIAAGFAGAFPTPNAAIEGLFDAPFHRASVLMDFLCAGSGVAIIRGPQGLSSNLVVDFAARRKAIRDNELIAYPYAGQVGVKTGWMALEHPNPMARAPQFEGSIVGYPITVNSAPDGILAVSKFELRDANGSSVPCEKTDGTDEPGRPFVAMCVPYSPLESKMRYTVSVEGVLTRGTVANRSFALSWSFATGRAASTAPPDAGTNATYDGAGG